jgi:hypothetical protein
MRLAFKLLGVLCFMCAALSSTQYIIQRRDLLAQYGYFDITSAAMNWGRPILISASIFLGLLSSALFAALNESRDTSGSSFRSLLGTRSILTAGIISPIVIASVYDKLAQIHDVLVLLLFGYQNGFLWEALISPIRRSK